MKFNLIFDFDFKFLFIILVNIFLIDLRFLEWVRFKYILKDFKDQKRRYEVYIKIYLLNKYLGIFYYVIFYVYQLFEIKQKVCMVLMLRVIY